MKLVKRISIALLAACVVGGSAVAMTACGGGTPETPVTSAVPSDSSGEYATVREYIEANPEDYHGNIDTLETMTATNTGFHWDCTITGGPNMLTYQFRSPTQLPEDGSASSYLQEYLESDDMTQTYTSMAGVINRHVAEDVIRVTIYFVNADGSILAEQDYYK